MPGTRGLVEGTATVENDSVVVTINTVDDGFAADMIERAIRPGDTLNMQGIQMPIRAVAGTLELTLAYPWPGSSAGPVVFIITRTSSEQAIADAAQQALEIRAKLATGLLLAPNGTGPLSERDLYDGEVAGFRFLATDTSPTMSLYVRVGAVGNWDGPQPVVQLGPIPAHQWVGEFGTVLQFQDTDGEFEDPGVDVGSVAAVYADAAATSAANADALASTAATAAGNAAASETAAEVAETNAEAAQAAAEAAAAALDYESPLIYSPWAL